MSVDIKDCSAVELLIKAAEKGSSVRQLSNERMHEVVNQAVDQLGALGLSRSKMAGAKFEYINGYGAFAASYRGTPYATFFTFTIKRDRVVIDKVYRDKCSKNENIVFLNESKFSHLYSFTKALKAAA